MDNINLLLCVTIILILIVLICSNLNINARILYQVMVLEILYNRNNNVSSIIPNNLITKKTDFKLYH